MFISYRETRHSKNPPHPHRGRGSTREYYIDIIIRTYVLYEINQQWLLLRLRISCFTISQLHFFAGYHVELCSLRVMYIHKIHCLLYTCFLFTHIYYSMYISGGGRTSTYFQPRNWKSVCWVCSALRLHVLGLAWDREVLCAGTNIGSELIHSAKL